MLLPRIESKHLRGTGKDFSFSFTRVFSCDKSRSCGCFHFTLKNLQLICMIHLYNSFAKATACPSQGRGYSKIVTGSNDEEFVDLGLLMDVTFKVTLF